MWLSPLLNRTLARDAGGMKTKAVKDGDDYILNGTKCFITGAPLAKYCVVFTKTKPELGSKGISTFVVDMSLPGVSVGKHEEKMGQLGLDAATLSWKTFAFPRTASSGRRTRASRPQ